MTVAHRAVRSNQRQNIVDEIYAIRAARMFGLLLGGIVAVSITITIAISASGIYGKERVIQIVFAGLG